MKGKRQSTDQVHLTPTELHQLHSGCKYPQTLMILVQSLSQEGPGTSLQRKRIGAAVLTFQKRVKTSLHRAAICIRGKSMLLLGSLLFAQVPSCATTLLESIQRVIGLTVA